MKPVNTFRHRHISGSALVISLFFIVLVSILALVFLSRSTSELQGSNMSSGMVQNEILTITAIETILGDIRQEMAAGAENEPSATEAMEVRNPEAMIPAKVLTDGISPTAQNFLNLVKQSVAGKAFYPAGASRASGVNTESEALGGRTVPAEKWNKVRLTGGTGFASGGSQTPNWILVQRRGVQEVGATTFSPTFADAAATNQDYVIGRFAYNIYHVGGLLDVNVAGYDTSDATAVTDAEKKGGSSWADLNVIPGIEDGDALVQWRNAAPSQPSSYLIKLQEWSGPNGFLLPYSDGTASDRLFFSRQDLLNYQKEFPSVLSEDALQYLTTFSRDLNQPSFAPAPNRPKVKDAFASWGNEAHGQDDKFNPAFLSIRDSEDPTQPLVKKRFPLDRLALITNTATAAPGSDIHKYFGLIRSSPNDPWVYAQESGSEIKQLSEIKGREPDFVELLQAAIHAGSLGKQYGSKAAAEPTTSLRNRNNPRGIDGYISLQVLQILANIIDQYDRDSFPTHIQFTPSGLGVQNLYGVENLPYLYSIADIMYRQALATPLYPAPDKPDPITAQTFSIGGDTYKIVVMLQPWIWNPHAPLREAPSEAPTRFRIVATSDTDVLVETKSYWRTPSGLPADQPTDFISEFPGLGTTEPEPFGPGDENSMFFNTTDSGAASFREPYSLKFPGYPPGSDATGYTTETVLQTENLLDPGYSEVIGFRAGYTWGGPRRGTETFYLYRTIVRSDGIKFELQYEKGGQFYTYNVMDYNPNVANHLPMWDEKREFSYGVRIDPRTSRWGLQGAGSMRLFNTPDNLTSNRYRPQGQTFRAGPNAAPPASGAPVRITARGTAPGWPVEANGLQYYGPESENRIDASENYTDPDGLRRGADGVFSRGGVGIPLYKTNGSDFSSRPEILNRPFRSVAELGYVFRDTPWRTLDFFSPESGDAALLDIFCIHEPADPDADPLVAGRVNLNTPHAVVLQALIEGTAKANGVKITSAESLKAAEALVDWTKTLTNNKGPLKNPSELIGKAINSTSYVGYSLELNRDNDPVFSSISDRSIKSRRESVMRALSDSGSTRTWNLLVDLIVQTGRYPATATSLDQFQVSSQRQYWIHLAMDRFTGQVIARQVEGVTE